MTAKSTDQHIADFRTLVFGGIEKALGESSHCKRYEGCVEYGVAWPSYFEPKTPPIHQLTLHCYVLGPQRHHSWHAPDVEQLFDLASSDVRKWIAELAEEADNVCEHGDHPAPPGQRFCSPACMECESTEHDATLVDCAGVCGKPGQP